MTRWSGCRGALALATVVAAPVAAQSMRSYTVARPVPAAPVPLRATVDFGAGRVAIRAGDPGQLALGSRRVEAATGGEASGGAVAAELVEAAPVAARAKPTGVLMSGLGSAARRARRSAGTPRASCR